ncbi:hypothetical protein HKX48_002984 [Thoreauomyces humboldtii]|nr:hypothetical protein HKX48_002984 [Thoreauomyces humboldtii]
MEVTTERRQDGRPLPRVRVPNHVAGKISSIWKHRVAGLPNIWFNQKHLFWEPFGTLLAHPVKAQDDEITLASFRLLKVVFWNAVSRCRTANHTTHFKVQQNLAGPLGDGDWVAIDIENAWSPEPDRYYGIEQRISVQENIHLMLSETVPGASGPWEVPPDRLIGTLDGKPNFQFPDVFYVDFGYIAWRTASYPARAVTGPPQPSTMTTDRFKSEFHKTWQLSLVGAVWVPSLQEMGYQVTASFCTVQIAFFEEPFLGEETNGARYKMSWRKEDGDEWRVRLETYTSHDTTGTALRVARTPGSMDIAFTTKPSSDDPPATSEPPLSLLEEVIEEVREELDRYYDVHSGEMNSASLASALLRCYPKQLGRLDCQSTTQYARTDTHGPTLLCNVTKHTVYWPCDQDPFCHASLSLRTEDPAVDLRHAQTLVDEAQTIADRLAPQ